MSRLEVRSPYAAPFKMNVTAFSAGLYGSVTSLQTKEAQHHFPVRGNQPNIQFSVIFSSGEEHERFQKFVRRQQVALRSANTASRAGVTLWWPERNIDNWTGIITEYTAGAQRFNWAPRGKFVVELVDSWVSRKTAISSFAAPWYSIVESSPFTRLMYALNDMGFRLPKFTTGSWDNPAQLPQQRSEEAFYPFLPRRP